VVACKFTLFSWIIPTSFYDSPAIFNFQPILVVTQGVKATLYVAEAAVSDCQSTSPRSPFCNIQGIDVGVVGLPGDANQNGIIRIADVTKILDIMANGGE